jgi:hypothetical protein
MPPPDYHARAAAASLPLSVPPPPDLSATGGSCSACHRARPCPCSGRHRRPLFDVPPRSFACSPTPASASLALVSASPPPPAPFPCSGELPRWIPVRGEEEGADKWVPPRIYKKIPNSWVCLFFDLDYIYVVPRQPGCGSLLSEIVSIRLNLTISTHWNEFTQNQLLQFR